MGVGHGAATADASLLVKPASLAGPLRGLWASAGRPGEPAPNAFPFRHRHRHRKTPALGLANARRIAERRPQLHPARHSAGTDLGVRIPKALSRQQEQEAGEGRDRADRRKLAQPAAAHGKPAWAMGTSGKLVVTAMARLICNQAELQGPILKGGERPILSWYAGQRIRGGEKPSGAPWIAVTLVNLISSTPPTLEGLVCVSVGSNAGSRFFNVLAMNPNAADRGHEYKFTGYAMPSLALRMGSSEFSP